MAIFFIHIFWANFVPKMNFFKLTEIWYRGRWPCAYFHFNVYFFKFSFHSSFFWQIWPQNLKFFRLTEKWHRDRLPYTYFDFNVYFFKIFGHPYFLWENLVPQKHTFAKLIEIWSSGTLYMLILTLTFIITKFFSFIFLGQVWSQNLKFFRLAEIWYRGSLPYTSLESNFFSFKILFIHIFGANLLPKSEVLQIDWSFVQM